MNVACSLVVMSARLGQVLVRYHGQRRRRASMSAGAYPAIAYQQITSDWTRKANGTARSTARWVRLRASPAPVTCLPAALDGSIGHRQD